MVDIYFRLRRKLAYVLGKREAVEKWSFMMRQKKVLPLIKARFDENIYPAVNVEINNTCNYNCPFCPHSTIKRSEKHISVDDFTCIISELKESAFEGQLVFSVNNEPFLHPNLMGFCELASNWLPNASTLLISNGSLIKQSHIEKMSSLERPPTLLIDDYTPKHKVIKRIESMDLSNKNVHIYYDDVSDSVEKPQDSIRQEKSAMHIRLIKRSWDEVLSNRAGNQDNGSIDLKYYQKLICTWPFGGIFISADMKVFLCCADFKYKVILGDLREQTIMDIWKSPAYKTIRNKMLLYGRGSLELCKNCDTEWYCLPEHCKD
jgi:MoaA/NifB/PqqE/SkfB family radical SAM enzyme